MVCKGLNLNLLGELIKNLRKERLLTQGQHGELVRVKKPQISKLENNTTNLRLDTVLRVFKAMKAKVKLDVQLEVGGLEME